MRWENFFGQPFHQISLAPSCSLVLAELESKGSRKREMSLPAPHTHARPCFCGVWTFAEIQSWRSLLRRRRGRGGRRRQSFKRLLQRRERDRRGESGRKRRGADERSKGTSLLLFRRQSRLKRNGGEERQSVEGTDWSSRCTARTVYSPCSCFHVAP